MTRNIETAVLVKTLFKHFQGYLRIVMDIDVYSLAGVNQWEEGKISPAIVWKV